MTKHLLILLFLALLIRMLFVFNPGFTADVAFWKSWSLAAADKGIVQTTITTNYNYAPAFLYFLKGLGSAYKILSGPFDFQSYWDVTNRLFLFLSKFPIIIADLLTGIGIWWLLKKEFEIYNLKFKMKGNEFEKFEKLKHLDFISNLKFQIKNLFTPQHLPLLGAAYYLLNPVIIFDGSYWGQVDSIGPAFILLAIILLKKEKPLLSAAAITLGALLKLQMIFFLPLFLVIIFKKYGWNKLVASVAAAAGVFIVVALPFIIAGEFNRISTLILSSSNYFPFISLNAYNFWWIFSGANGMGMSDKLLLFGTTNANFLSLFLFGVIYFWSLIYLFRNSTESALYKSGLLIAFAFFMIPTQMHERYIYPVFLFLALLIPEAVRLFREKSNKLLLYCYLVILLGLPVTGFYNLHNVMVLNYPEYSLPLLDKLNIKNITLLVAWINSILFIIYAFVFLKEIHASKTLNTKYKILNTNNTLLLAIVVLPLLFLGIKQVSFLLKKQIPLTDIKPIYAYQDYGTPGKDITVNSNFSYKSQAFLSTQYYFYRKGIGSHANARFIYPLENNFNRFTADVGIDTEAAAEASVDFIVMADNRVLFQSGKMTKFDLPKHLDVPLSGAKDLLLIIMDAGDGINGDHANWFNPTLYK